MGLRLTLSVLVTAAVVSVSSALTPVERTVIWTRVWNEVSANFVGFDSTARGISRQEWDKGFNETLNRLVEARSDVEFWRILRVKLGELNDGQTRLKLPRGLPREYDTVPIRLLFADHRVLVSAVSSSADVALAGVNPGDELLSVDGIPVRNWIERECMPHVSGSTYFGRFARATERAMTGSSGSIGRFTFARPDGSEYAVQLKRDTGPQSEYYRELFGDSLVHSRLINDHVLYLDFKSTLSPAAETWAMELIDQHFKATALILDLRDTHSGELPRKLLARLAFFPLPLGAYREVRSRFIPNESGELGKISELTEVLEEVIKPIPPAFRGKVVVLVGPRTSGVAEQFLQPLVFASRAILIGSPTAGSGGQVMVLDLGESASVSITVRKPAWEGGYGDRCGFPPSILVAATAQGLAAGKDEVLESALDFLREPHDR